MALLLAGASLVSAGCGPVLYTVNGIPATATLSEAQAEHAERFAPYEFFLASAYLEKAREEAAQAHYEDANHFAEVASEAAGRARDIARERRRASSR